MPKTMTLDVHNARFIRERGFAALTEELGAVGTVYFLRQFSNGSGNWTEDRKIELDGLSMADIEKDIVNLKNEQNTVFAHRNIKTVH